MEPGSLQWYMEKRMRDNVHELKYVVHTGLEKNFLSWRTVSQWQSSPKEAVQCLSFENFEP